MTCQLNEYQLQVVQNLNAYGVQFLVIGGVVRSVMLGKPTRDLDLWVSISGENKKNFGKALIAWQEKYSAHAPVGGYTIGALRPLVHITMPEDDALYLDKNKDVQSIAPADGVDLLTTILGELDFDEAWQRGSDCIFSGVSLRLMSLDDVELSSKDKLSMKSNQ